jgi:hypothetical protein
MPIKCPTCLEPATRAELKKYGGMCEACKDEFEAQEAMYAEEKRQELEYMCEE